MPGTPVARHHCRMGRRPFAVVVAAIVAVTLSSCVPAPQAKHSAVPAVAGAPIVLDWTPPDRSQQLLVQIEDDASTEGPTLQQAIDGFALTFGGMPGATPSTLPPGDGLGLTYALGIIQPYRAQLDPAQRARLEQVSPTTPLAAPASSVTPAGIRPPTLPAAPVPEPAPPVKARFQAMMEQAAKDWQKYKPEFDGMSFSIEYEPSDLEVASEGGKKAAMAAWTDSPGSTSCTIHAFLVEWTQPPADDKLRHDFAHEIFHCFQSRWGWDYAAVPSWALEGAAEFATMDLYRAGGLDSTFSLRWFEEQKRPLAAVTYDGWAWFETFRQGGGDPYLAMRKLMAGHFGGTANALAAAGMDDLAMRIRMGSASGRLTSVVASPDPTKWNLAWPGTPSAGPHDKTTPIGPFDIGVKQIEFNLPFSHVVLKSTWSEKVDLVTFVSSSNTVEVIAKDANGVLAPGQSESFCFREDQCTCPDGEYADAIPLSERELYLAPASTGAKNVLTIRSETWDPEEWCEKKKPAKTASTNGDPHLTSLDGLSFDVMSSGEFVSTKDPKGGFEVQTRQVQLDGHAQPASGNMAVAVGVDGHRFTATADEFELAAPITVRVDGKVVTGKKFDVGKATVTEGASKLGNRSWVLTLADDTSVTMTWSNWFFIDISVPSARAARMVGLLGSGDGNLANELRRPDGTVLPTGGDLEKDFAQKWLVEQRTSLFDYDPGKTTESYRTAPGATVSRSDRYTAECTAKLGAQAIPSEISSCAFDLTITGLKQAVEQYAALVDHRVADQKIDWVPVPRASDSVGAINPKAGAATLSLTLGKVVTATSFGRINVPAGAFMMFTTPSCRNLNGGKLTMQVGYLDAGKPTTGEISLCGNVADAGSAPAETYALSPAGGQLSFQLASTTGTDVAAEVWVDPTPTVLTAAQLTAPYSGTLSGVADAILIPAALAKGSSGWRATGVDTACWSSGAGAPTPEPYIELNGLSGFDGSCRHTTDLSTSEVINGQHYIVLFSHTPGTSRVTLTPR